MSTRRKRIGILRSRAKAMSQVATDPLKQEREEAIADETIHRMIAGGSRRPAVAALASKPEPLTAGEKSAIFLNAAQVILSDHGGRNLQELKRAAATRRISLR